MKNNRYYQRRNRFKQNNDKQNHFIGNNRQVLDFANGLNYRRRSNNKNHQNVSKLISKYSELAKEALSKGDKISSENYNQYAEHFLRIANEKNLSNEVSSDIKTKIDEEKNVDSNSANS